MPKHEFLLGPNAPTAGALQAFPQRPSGSGASFKGREMELQGRRSIALLALGQVRRCLEDAIARRVLAEPLWATESETLCDRLDVLIGELTQAGPATDEQVYHARLGLQRARTVLTLAGRTGLIRDTLWASPCERLNDYIDWAIAELFAPPELPQ